MGNPIIVVTKIWKLNETGLVNWLSALSVHSLCNCRRKSNQGFCPKPTQYAATAFGSGTACTLGWDYPQFIIPMCGSSNNLRSNPLSYCMDYRWLIDAANSQTIPPRRAWYCYWKSMITTIGAVLLKAVWKPKIKIQFVVLSIDWHLQMGFNNMTQRLGPVLDITAKL